MSLKDAKIGLIGAGNMGSAILEGILHRKLAEPQQLFVHDKIREKTDSFAQARGVSPQDSIEALLQAVDIVLLAIKPQDLAETASVMRPGLKPGHIVISILAGMSVSRLKSALGEEAAIVRAMPNLGAQAGQSFTAITSEDTRAAAAAEQILQGCGRTAQMPESSFDWVTALSGSGPAYFFLLMEYLAAKAVESGVDGETARLMAVQTAFGAASVAVMSRENPAGLRARVSSKGGTTEAALKVLNDEAVGDVFSRAFEAAEKRSRELRQE